MEKNYQIKVFKVEKSCICDATDGYCSMNCCTQWFESYVVDVNQEENYFLVAVKSTFDYPYVTNQWDKWMYKEKKEDQLKSTNHVMLEIALVQWKLIVLLHNVLPYSKWDSLSKRINSVIAQLQLQQ